MTQICDILDALCELAPLELQMDFDNSGFQFGHADREVKRVLLSLDLTDAVAEEARELGAELVITHHPLLFTPLRSVCDTEPIQRRVLRMIENGIGLISMHTNLDIAKGGVNDVLIRMLGAVPEQALDRDGCGRVGNLPEPVPFETFLQRCRGVLKVNGLRYYASGKPVSRLAVMGGAGGDAIEDAAAKGCDTYVTADLKYHQFLRAEELGLNLIDADHFSTENPVIPVLADKLSQRFPEVSFFVSKRHEAVIRFA